MKLGCCIGSAQYDLVAECGYDTIAFPGVELAAMSEASFQKLAEKVKHGPLAVCSVNSFCPAELRLTGWDLDLDALREYAQRLFHRAAALGVRYIGIGGPASRSTRPGENEEDALRDMEMSLRLLCSIGEPLGITVLLESVCSLECNLITRTEEAAQLVRRMDLPNLGLVYDIYHAHMMGEDPRYILEVADLIKVVHIAQDCNGKRIYLRNQNFHEYLPYFQALSEIKYKGECNMESFAGDIAEELPNSLTILKELLETSKID